MIAHRARSRDHAGIRSRIGFLAAAAAGLAASVVPAAGAPGPPSGLRVVLREEGRALLEWQAPGDGIQGYKIRPSYRRGSHPDPTTYPGGRPAAFTWTTDDGLEDNLAYEPSFTSRGLPFTAFVIPSTLGEPGRLAWDDLDSLCARGHEIASHTEDHRSLIDDRALWIRAIDPSTTLTVAGTTLTTATELGGPDLVVDLEDPTVDHLVELAAWLDARPGYDAGLLYCALEIPATRSSFLDPVAGLAIGGALAETLTTDRGVHDDTEMHEQIDLARATLEAHLRSIDPGYTCRTLAYPNHAHTQWAMSTLNELGCRGARSGNPGDRPFSSEGRFDLGFQTTYEVPLNWPRPDNAWDEATTRQKYRERVAAWKANREWAVLMAHGESESDAQHVEWMIDEIASDPEVWIAAFGDVIEWLATWFVDVGNPDDGSGTVRAWIHGLDDARTAWIVVTAYDEGRAESGWSEEIPLLPIAGPTAADPRTTTAARDLELRAWPNPARSAVHLAGSAGLRGPVHLEIVDVAGRRVRVWDLAPSSGAGFPVWDTQWDGRDDRGRTLPAGVYFVRARDVGGATAAARIVREP